MYKITQYCGALATQVFALTKYAKQLLALQQPTVTSFQTLLVLKGNEYLPISLDSE
jgi:hypothetical protein